MRNLIIYRPMIAVVLLLAVGCTKNFDDINTDPNSTEKVTAPMLATHLIMSVVKSTNGKEFTASSILNKQIAWGEDGHGYMYNRFGRTGFSAYQVLANIEKMNEAAPESNKNAYLGLGLFVKAYKLFYLSLDVGDIPYSDAAKGEEGSFNPLYDTQKQVMQQVLADLASANEAFATASAFDGDPVFDGDVTAWRKVVNAFRLKVLINLSLKENDSDLNIKSSFAAIVGNEPLLDSNDDNLQLVYSDRQSQQYPFNTLLHKHIEYPMLTSVLIDTLKKYNDYRLFYYANPAAYAIDVEGKAANDWDAYPGVDPTLVFSTIKDLWTANKFCLLNDRYVYLNSGEPLIRIGYAEQNFIIAEGIVRGWINGDAEAYYKNGISSAMQFIVDHTPNDDRYHHGRPITTDYVDNTYMEGQYVIFATDPQQQLRQILTQRAILYFMQHHWDGYYDYRRTGLPVWPIDPNTNQNDDPNKVPVRFMYPQKEYNMNNEHLQEALQRQYGGQDKVDDLMWILKP